MPDSGPLQVILENLPRFLKEFLLWCVWIGSYQDRQGKFPVSPISGTLIGVDRAYQWYPYKDAVEAYGRGVGVGLGVLLRAEDHVVGIDLDDAIGEDGAVATWAATIVSAIPTYWELSPSGRGLRGFVRGTLPPNCPKKKAALAGGRIEVYCEGRFLTVTGHRLEGSTPDVQDCPVGLQSLVSLMGMRHDSSPTPNLPFADAARIVSGCAWMRHCRDDAATLPEPEWYAMLSVLGRCQNGERLAQEWSCSYPGYSEAETQAKLEQALGRSGPTTCEYVERDLGQARFCVVCPNRGRVRSPIMLGTDLGTWPQPERLDTDFARVAKFDILLLPDNFRRYAIDVAERMQVPLDFLGAALLVSLAGVTGRRARVRPKRLDDWEEAANLWGGVVAEPGTMKTPSIKRVLKILNQLEAEASQNFAEAMGQYERDSEAYKARERAWKQQHETSGETFGEVAPLEPTCVRFIVNDATVAKLQEIHAQNPAGFLMYRDELAGWIANLDSTGHQGDRPFYLECWSGDEPFTVDRIMRGTIRASKKCLSVFGGIQPSVSKRYLLDAMLGGKGDDGLMQRLQVMVYPDRPETWENVDREPDRDAEEAATSVFRFISTVQPDIFVARFDSEAQDFFNSWRNVLEHRLLREQMPTYLRSHLAKYRGLMPRIALLCHLADSGLAPEISLLQVRRAADWCAYLETHARRVYAEGSPRSMAAVLGERLRAGALGTRFTIREIRKKGWTGFDDQAVIRVVLQELEDAGWVRKVPNQPSERGGRPAEAYNVNPKVLQA